MDAFTPCYILPSEFSTFGLPPAEVVPDILNLVQMASSLIDVACGRIDGDGNGSLAYTTYVQRNLLQTRNRNLVLLAMKPVVPVTQAVVDELVALAASGNYYYTGVLPNTQLAPWGSPSAIIGASGRYGYTRQDMSVAYPDLQALINPLNLVTLFGGPAPWVPIDISNTDYDKNTGEMWIPAGLQLQRYAEVLVQYNSGFDPRNMPRAIKHVCSSLVKNALGKGSGTTGLTSMMVQGAGNAQFVQQLIDPTLDAYLAPYKMVRAY
jgi:hypothetical protein